VLDELARRDKRVFVDLKFFDIPATAAAVIKRLSQWPVSYATIHGWHPAMMEACAAANSSDMRLLAVTVLTSMGRPDLAQMGIDREPVDVVVERALAAQAAGIDGVIAWAPARSAPPPARVLDRLPGHPPRWPGRR
jgi:orotidine-5'-phosphate decarboxylase